MARATGRQPGRPSKPAALELLQGNPGKRGRKPADPAQTLAVPPSPPNHLKAEGRRAWKGYWEAGRAWLTLADLEAVTLLCELHDQAKLVTLRIEQEGLLQLSDDTGRSFIHRAYNDLRGIRGEMRALWSALYMTPSDRARANLAPPKEDAVAAWEASA